MDVRQRYDTHLSQQQQQRRLMSPATPLRASSSTSGYDEAMVPANLKLVELRTELKKRGLSPSGLKHVLVKRLEDALADPTTSFPAINRPPPSSGSGVTGANSSRARHQQLSRHQPHHSPHGSDDAADDGEDGDDDLRNALEEGEDGDFGRGEQNNINTKNSNEDDDEDAEGEEDDSYFDAGEAYVGVNNTKDSSFNKKRKSPPSSSTTTATAPRTSNSSRRRHQEKKLKKYHSASSSLSLLSAAAASTESTPLSGFTFVKEARYAKQQQHQQQHEAAVVEEIKSLEQFRFEGSAFFFSYQFWRGHTLLHSFEVEAGTFLIVEDEDTPAQSSGHQQQQQQQHSSTTTTSHYGDITTTTTTTTTTTASSNRQRKVVLHWPSPVYYPLLQTWRFHQTYSHFLLHEPAAATNASPSSALTATATNSSAPSSHPSSPLPPPATSCSGGRPCLISRLGSVFVQD